ncbi:MAG: Rne/Rng family ribonuclease [bacterium]
MGKELIVSANRHETKVAILEDDQLVEVYFQRANEYSLAGSIHKGRVTRVLPGMQSAFVDLGLERDAFLYVSDFFEDNEEYDRLAAAAEDKALKAEREGRGQREARETREHREQLVQAPEAPEAAPEPPAPTPDRERERGFESEGGHERRGRRGRRRRQRGRGFPESKYADIGAAQAPEEPSEAVFTVLPGESLAKYGHAAPAGESEEEEFAVGGAGVSSEQPEAAPEEAGEAPESALSEPAGDMPTAEEAPEEPTDAEAEESIEREPEQAEEEPGALTTEEAQEQISAVTLSESAEPEEAGAEQEPEENAIAEPGEASVPETAGPALEFEETEGESVRPDTVVRNEDDEPVPGAEPVGPGGLVTVLPDQFIPEAGESEDTPEAGESEEAPEAGESEETPEAGESEETAAAGETAAEEAVEEEGVEPARMPVSLTATLREQGYRYPHRLSRRMRRKLRGQALQQEAPSEQKQETEPETRTARGRQERPERAERPERERPPQPSISELLKEGQEILVQIAKEPLGQKGARITSHIALPGRYVVYMPTVEHLGVSRKISSDEERFRLKRILQTHRTGIPGGFIVRTAGEGRTEQEIADDMRFLFNLWLDIRQRAESRPAPALIHHDLDLVSRVLRDQMADNFKSIWVDNEEIYEQVLRFVERFQPSAVGRVKLYTREAPIFDAFNISNELEKALRPKVWLKSGGYIVINQTEALVAIDVNTGKFVGKSNRLEDTIVKTNTEAVKEIVRQIRLRDLGGIIVVDFIDMDERKNRQKVMQALEEAMRADRAPNKILQFNDFGLVAITRKRVKQSLERTLCAPCPYCEGAGYVKSVQTIVGEILQEAQRIARAVEGKDCTLRVHPEVAKLLKSSENHYLEELEETLRRPVIVISDPMLNQEKFDLV